MMRFRLASDRRVAIVGIGDETIPLDRVGIEAAKEIERMQLTGVHVFIAGTVPESITGSLRVFSPQHVILFDVADFGSPPGTVTIVDPHQIALTQVSTHTLPLSVVMEFIRKDIDAEVTLLGIQPDLNRKDDGLSAEGTELLYRYLEGLAGVLRERWDLR
jgi:hydrogenase 3 maturation protease